MSNLDFGSGEIWFQDLGPWTSLGKIDDSELFSNLAFPGTSVEVPEELTLEPEDFKKEISVHFEPSLYQEFDEVDLKPYKDVLAHWKAVILEEDPGLLEYWKAIASLEATGPGTDVISSLRNSVAGAAQDETLNCPRCWCYCHDLWNVVIHLNDTHRWDRERIADWVEATAEEHGIDISFPTPDEIPKEPGEE